MLFRSSHFFALLAIGLVSACDAGEPASANSGTDERHVSEPPAADPSPSAPSAAPDKPTEPDPGKTAAAAMPLTFDDLPDCDREQPSLACVEKLFAPLHGAGAPKWAFDAAKVSAAMGTNEFAVAPGVDLTAHHVLEGNLQIGVYGCFFDQYRYAKDVATPLTGPGCGAFLAAGGHPHAAACEANGTPMGNCVDEVPIGELFDIVLAPATARAGVLDVADDPAVGDAVYAIGYPSFAWLSDAERATIAPRYPLVSLGHVVHVEGHGVVANTAVFGGNSGGPMIDANGEVVGVIVTKVGHQRARGTTVPTSLKDEHAVAVMPDGAMKALVATARQ